MIWLERLLAWAFPIWTSRRMRARRALAELERSRRGAAVGGTAAAVSPTMTRRPSRVLFWRSVLAVLIAATDGAG